MNSAKTRQHKLIIATPLFPPELGEPAEYVRTLAKKLSKKYSVTVVTYADQIEKIQNVKIKNVPKNQHAFVRFFMYTRALIRVSRSADIVYAQRSGTAGLSAIVARWFTKTPVIVNYIEDEAWERLTHPYPTLHQGQFRKMQKIPGAVWLVWHIQHLVLRRADAVLVPSAFLRGEVAHTHGLKSQHVYTVYLPPQKEIRLPLSPPRSKHTVYVDTQLVTWKDIATAVRTVALLKGAFPDVALVVAGDGPERQALEELVEEKKLENHVTFLGRVSKAERLYHLKSAGVYFSPARYEDRPDTLYEAIQCGVPVAISDVPGQREQFTHKKNALILPPGNALACADAFEEIFTDTVLVKALTQNALKLFASTFSWNVHEKKLLRLLKKTASR